MISFTDSVLYQQLVSFLWPLPPTNPTHTHGANFVVTTICVLYTLGEIFSFIFHNHKITNFGAFLCTSLLISFFFLFSLSFSSECQASDSSELIETIFLVLWVFIGCGSSTYESFKLVLTFFLVFLFWFFGCISGESGFTYNKLTITE